MQISPKTGFLTISFHKVANKVFIKKGLASIDGLKIYFVYNINIIDLAIITVYYTKNYFENHVRRAV